MNPRTIEIFLSAVLDGKSHDEIAIEFEVEKNYVSQIIHTWKKKAQLLVNEFLAAEGVEV